MPLKKADIKKYREALIDRKRQLLSNVANLENEALGDAASDGGGNLSTMPLHMADIGSDTYEQEKNLDLMETEREELLQINEAFRRIEEGKYGVCDDCEKAIPKKRLDAIPYAVLCITCKEKQESEEGYY
jgi:DnaK suppressor protein